MRANCGLTELGRSDAGDVDAHRRWLQSHRCSAIGRSCASRTRRIGLHHLGIAVENVDETVERYRAFNPRGVVVA